MAKDGSTEECYSFKNISMLEYDLGPNVIKCSSFPSLKQVTSSKIAIALWQHYGIRSKFSSYHSENKFRVMSFYDDCLKVIKDSISNLNLPVDCRVVLDQKLGLVGREIGLFIVTHKSEGWKRIATYLKFLSWTNQCTINYSETYIKIINHSNLSLFVKYFLACDNCLEPTIWKLLKKLPNRFVKKLLKDQQIEWDSMNDRLSNGKEQHLVMFWTFYLRGEEERFTEVVQTTQFYMYLLKWSIRNNKIVAVQYIWENFADIAFKSQLLNLTKIATDSDSNENILLYLITHMNQIQLEEFCLNSNLELIFLLKKSSRWRPIVVPVLKYFLTIITKFGTSCAMYIIQICWKEHIFTLKEYETFWHKFVSQPNFNMKKYEEMFSCFFITLFLTHFHDKVTVKFLLRDGTYQIKRNLLYSESGMNICVNLLCSESPDLFDWLVSEMMLRRKKISQFTHHFFLKKITTLCSYMMTRKDLNSGDIFIAFHKMEEILIKFYPNEVSRYRKELPYKDNGYIIHQILQKIPRIPNLLKVLDQFLIWAFEGNKKEIANCKAEIFHIKNIKYDMVKVAYFEQVEKVMNEINLDFVKQWLKWVFDANKRRIKSANNKLTYIMDILYLTSSKKGCVLFKMFVTSCFEEKEVEKIIEKLRDSQHLFIITRDMIRLGRYSDVEDLLDWCYSSKISKSKFKESFMVSKGGCSLLCKMIEDYTFDTELDVKPLYMWFNPSIRAARVFRTKVSLFIDRESSTKEVELSRSRFCTRWNAHLLQYSKFVPITDKEKEALRYQFWIPSSFFSDGTKPQSNGWMESPFNNHIKYMKDKMIKQKNNTEKLLLRFDKEIRALNKKKLITSE